MSVSSLPILPPKTMAESKVVIRCCSMNEKEIRDGHTHVVKMDTKPGAVDVIQDKTVLANLVYDYNCCQEDIESTSLDNRIKTDTTCNETLVNDATNMRNIQQPLYHLKPIII